jgi:hypothetical protein
METRRAADALRPREGTSRAGRATRRAAPRSSACSARRRCRASEPRGGPLDAQGPATLAFNLMTRSKRITYDNPSLRDPRSAESAGGRPSRNPPPPALRPRP